MSGSDEGRAGQKPERGAAATVRTIEAAELLGPGGVLRIAHHGEVYTLRLTRNDRLILTK